MGPILVKLSHYSSFKLLYKFFFQISPHFFFLNGPHKGIVLNFWNFELEAFKDYIFENFKLTAAVTYSETM